MKTIALLLLTTALARAEVAVYNITARQTVVGLGVETTLVHTGVLLWDIDTGDAWEIHAFRTGGAKRFTVSDRSDSLLYEAEGRLGRVYSAVLQVTNAPDRQAITFTFGRNSTFPLRPGRTVFLPRTGRFTGYAIVRFPAGDVFGPIAGAYSFSPARTRLAYNNGQTLDQAVAAWRAHYTALGYVE